MTIAVAPDPITSWWRVGRRNGRVVYALRGDVASDDDNTLLGKQVP